MTPFVAAPRARAARGAVSVLFIANGALSASILPRLPAIKDGLGLSNAELGAAVAAMPVGGLIAGGLAGILIARFGSGRVATTAGTAACLLIIAVGLAPSWAALAGAYLVLGMFDATMDAAMNTHGVGVQRVYGRSILQGFHGAWSAGGMAAGAVGAIAAAAGIPVAVHLTVVGVALAAAVLATARGLLPAPIADAHEQGTSDAPAEAIHARNAGRLLRVLVPVAMLGILCVVVQTAGATWGAVFANDVLGLSAGIAASVFVVYSASMTLGRLTNDRWVDRLGTTSLVRIGALVAAAGLVAVMASAALAVPLLAFAGFALVGAGTSPMFPVMVAAAGSRPGIPSGYGVSLVSWMVRIGLVFAPAIVGVAADRVGLAAAMAIPLATALLIAAVAPSLTGSRRRGR